MRAIDELTEVDDPAWPELEDALADSPVPTRVLPAHREEGRRCLLQLQVTARSMLGALVLHTGGLLLDNGWVRVFGGAGTGVTTDGDLPSLGQVNLFPATFDPAWQPAAGLVVGHDAVGGVFALNGHDPAAAGRPGTPGQMTYFAPDTLRWEALELGHSAWLAWLLSGRTEEFYSGTRWPGWRAEAEALALSQGFSVYPSLWSQEAQADLSATARRAVPMDEVLGSAAEFAGLLGLPDPGFLGAV
ncbi:DUF2625 domain-containing protein [Kitasatospora sp. NPDC005856]|uniref:DUF2625 domain-containing protein n=1 Tax=Kitasatospora sp. NPDC005856 TaxID=3154566 RepID=UPI003404687C